MIHRKLQNVVYIKKKIDVKKRGDGHHRVLSTSTCERNKIIQIADRHGWDEVNEYSIPLADDNEDAVKLRAAINMATRKRAKPYERSNSTFTTGRGFFRRQPATSNQQKATSQHFQQERVSSVTSQDISPNSAHINSDSTHQGKHQVPISVQPDNRPNSQ